MKRLSALMIAAAICLVVCLAWLADRYHTNATEYKRQRDEKTQELQGANTRLSDMARRQDALAELDVRKTRELKDAKDAIAQLELDVAAGKRRLRLNATCKPVRESTGTTGLDDGDAARLTDAAQRDYFALRERIEVVTAQLAGLQEYIREQCLKK
ncbi:bacteriophage lysis protein [Klebsiella pneumoniae]|nr:bacteriophage lysis protein [Klebsiella pneumoniae]